MEQPIEIYQEKYDLLNYLEHFKKEFLEKQGVITIQNIRSYQRQIEDLEQTANNKFGGAMPITDGLPF